MDWLVDEKNVVKAFITLPTEYVYFAWQKFLHILPNPNTFTDPEVFRNSFLSVRSNALLFWLSSSLTAVLLSPDF